MGFFLLVLVLTFGIVTETFAQDKSVPEAIARGKEIYLKRCWFCHGPEGEGDGSVADYLNPRPRNFTTGVYKLRTTQSGEAPLDDDLFRTITKGIPGTAMQGFENVLTKEERQQVIAFLKTFAPDNFESSPEPAQLGTEQTGDLAKGKELYQKAKCWECHGQEGRGDGPSAGQLTDDWGFSILPADLTKGWRYKGGNTVRDIFIRFTTGMDGTPMPTFADAFSEEDRWNLAAYVRSFITEEKGEGEVVMHTKQVHQDLPLDPDDPLWQQARPINVPMSGQVIVPPRWQNPSVDQITVRSLYNDKVIGFLVEWNDRFKDTVHQEESLPSLKEPVLSLSTDTYAKVLPEKKWILRDAIAIQFPVKIPEGLERPYFFLGQLERPVVLWYWKADWDEDPERKTPVEVLSATSFRDPLVPLPDESQIVMGKGVFQAGRWKVVMIRSLATGSREKDITFAVGRPIPIAFYAWDGSNGEQQLLMSLSSWFYLILEASTPTTVYLYAFLAVLGGFGVELSLVRWVRSRPTILGREPVIEPGEVFD
jgi:DMSO reductase family type II enzyme heme b subunit